MSDSEIRPSLNEVASLARKAVRGAGRSWGIAEEAASCVRWLSAHALPGPQLLAGLLHRQHGLDIASLSPNTDRCLWAGTGDHICPLLAAAAFSDEASVWQYETDMVIEMADLAYPILLLPSVARVAALSGGWLRVYWDDISVSTDGQSVCLKGPLNTLLVEQTKRFQCARALDRVTLRQTSERQSVDRASWELLESYAHRTYAPATEASRRLGAGAGSTQANED